MLIENSNVVHDYYVNQQYTSNVRLKDSLDPRLNQIFINICFFSSDSVMRKTSKYTGLHQNLYIKYHPVSFRKCSSNFLWKCSRMQRRSCFAVGRRRSYGPPLPHCPLTYMVCILCTNFIAR